MPVILPLFGNYTRCALNDYLYFAISQNTNEKKNANNTFWRVNIREAEKKRRERESKKASSEIIQILLK